MIFYDKSESMEALGFILRDQALCMTVDNVKDIIHNIYHNLCTPFGNDRNRIRNTDMIV